MWHVLAVSSLGAAWTLSSAPQPRGCIAQRAASPRMGFFDALGDAFANDADLSGRKETGMSKKVEVNTITWKGQKPMFGEAPTTTGSSIAGQKLQMLAREAGVPIEYSCNEGHCRVCDVLVDGRRVPACVAKAPKGSCTIEYGIPRGSVKPTKRAAPARSRSPSRGPARAEEEEEEESPAEKQLRLQQQLMGEMAGKKKNSWPFG